MARILLIDDDECCLDLVGRLLRLNGYAFSSASTGDEGLRLAREWKPEVALVDLRLPDTSGLEVLAHLKTDCPQTRRVMFTGYATLDAAIDAMRLGTCDCLKKPAFEEDILAAVERAVAQQRDQSEIDLVEPALSPAEAHAATRWAEPIVRAIDTPQDPRTLDEFGRAVFVSVGCFRNWCRTNRVSSRASLAFARALRSVYRFERDHSTRPENLLSIVDQRTITSFVRRCGGIGNQLPNTVGEFLERQQFITNPDAIEAVRALLQQRTRLTIKGVTMPNTRDNAADRSGGTTTQ